MATQRNMYEANNSSVFLPTYADSAPHRANSSFEDVKSEDDIIDSYSTTAVPIPKQAYPGNHSSTHLPTNQPVPFYPPYNQKPSFHSTNMSTTDFGTEENSNYQLHGTKEMPQAEKRSLIETLLPDSLACRLYVLVVLIETIIDIAIEVELRARVEDFGSEIDGDLRTRQLPVYLAIFAAAHVFQFVLAIDAVHARNTLQFMGLTGFNALLLIYAIIQISEIRQSLPPNDSAGGISNIPVNVLTTIIPIVISVAEIAYIALGWKIWREFGWKVYKRLGADRRVKKMYGIYQVFLCIMKFDLFIFVAFCVQLIALVLLQRDWEWYLTCAALPFSVVVLIVGWTAARRENKYMMISFIVGCISAMVYFIFKLYRLYNSGEDIANVTKTLTVFAVIAILLLLSTVVIAFIVMRNFGSGLKSKIAAPARSGSLKRGKASIAHLRNQSYPMSSNPNRMSID